MEFIRILLYYFQTNACIRLKQQFLKERIKIYLKIEKNLQDHYLHKWKQYMITLTSEIKHIQLFEKLYRIDNRDYPEVAVREALLNCLVHRDYGYSSSILISMYEDRLEFTSIGGLVTGVTLEDVMMGISVCRNKRLANVFYRLELIEAYGTGIQKIMNAYQDQFIKPEIKVSNNVFKIILPNTNAQAELREELQYHTHIQPEDEETQIMQMIDQEKELQRKQVTGKIRNQSDNEWKDFEADGKKD